MPGRTINSAGYDDSAGMTIQKCIAFCESKGFAYAGVEYSVECFCGSSPAAAATQVSATECNMACSGDASQPCGGPDRLNLFHTTATVVGPQPNPGVNGFKYMGCYTEGTTGRALTYGVPASVVPSAEMTVAKCTAACLAANYILAGVEYSGECCKSSAPKPLSSLCSSQPQQQTAATPFPTARRQQLAAATCCATATTPSSAVAAIG